MIPVNYSLEAGKHLFRFRGLIGAVLFAVLAFFSRPSHAVWPHALVLCGLAIRFWAAGYIGPAGRKKEFHAEYMILNGPYRMFKHPLYLANFLLVLGTLIMYNPPLWLWAGYVGLFFLIYVPIALAERQFLRGKPGREARFRIANLRGETWTWIVLAVIYLVYLLLGVLKHQPAV